MAHTIVLFICVPEKAERTVIEKTSSNFGGRSETCTSAIDFLRPTQRRRGGTVMTPQCCLLEERRRTQDMAVYKSLFGERGGSAPIDLSSTCFGPIKEEVSDEGKKRGLRERYLYAGRALGLGPKMWCPTSMSMGRQNSKTREYVLHNIDGKSIISSLIFTFPSLINPTTQFHN